MYSRSIEKVVKVKWKAWSIFLLIICHVRKRSLSNRGHHFLKMTPLDANLLKNSELPPKRQKINQIFSNHISAIRYTLYAIPYTLPAIPYTLHLPPRPTKINLGARRKASLRESGNPAPKWRAFFGAGQLTNHKLTNLVFCLPRTK